MMCGIRCIRTNRMEFVVVDDFFVAGFLSQTRWLGTEGKPMDEERREK